VVLFWCHFFENEISGVVATNQTGVKEYIPENILVSIATHNNLRGKGIAKLRMQKTIDLAGGSIALHIEPENLAVFHTKKLGIVVNR